MSGISGSSFWAIDQFEKTETAENLEDLISVVNE